MMAESHREILLSGLLNDMAKYLAGDADYSAPAKRIWDTASAMTSYEDKLFPEYLQWFEGNLDMLLNLGAEREAIERFLQDQMALIEGSRNDATAMNVAYRQDALTYLRSTR
jgi:hypothetical protein